MNNDLSLLIGFISGLIAGIAIAADRYAISDKKAPRLVPRPGKILLIYEADEEKLKR